MSTPRVRMKPRTMLIEASSAPQRANALARPGAGLFVQREQRLDRSVDRQLWHNRLQRVGVDALDGIEADPAIQEGGDSLFVRSVEHGRAAVRPMQGIPRQEQAGESRSLRRLEGQGPQGQ